MLYSKSTGGFYSHEVHGASIPADAKSISDDEYQALLAGQSAGKRIVADGSGDPVLADHAPPGEEEIDVIAASAVRGMLDARARAWQYSSYESARTYLNDKSPKYSAEAKALCDNGSDCYTLLDQIKAGEIQRPADLAGLLALLPPAPPRPTV